MHIRNLYMLISGVVLIKPEEDCRQLFKMAYGLMAPGGNIKVQDYIRLEDNPARYRLDTLENLYAIVVFDPRAGDREGTDVASWLEGAGFVDTQLVPLPTQLDLVTADRP